MLLNTPQPKHAAAVFVSVLIAVLACVPGRPHAAESWQRLDTDLGPVYFLDAVDFPESEGIKAIQRKKGPPFLQFSGNTPRATTIEFSLPKGGRHALILYHEGMPHSRVTLNARSYKLPDLPAPDKGASSLYLDTYDFLETINEISVVGGQGGRLRAVVLSSPLARMRDLAMHRSALEVKRQTLLWILTGKLRTDQASKTELTPGLLQGLETLRGQSRKDLAAWDKAYAGLASLCRQVETTRKPQAMAAAHNRLLKRLEPVESALEWIRSQFARNEALDPAGFRLAPGVPDPDTFQHYAWMAIRAPFLAASKGVLDRFRLLAIDAFALQHNTWPEPRMAEILTPRRFYCILKHDSRFALDSPGAGAMWSEDYALSFETYLRNETIDYAQARNILAIAYWTQAAQAAGKMDDFGQTTAWDNFLQAHGAPGSTGIPGATAPMNLQFKYRRFLEDRLTDHFRQFNQIMAQNLPRTPRLGLFIPAPPGPTAPATQLGLNPYRLLLDTGFPAVGIATSSDLRRLAWAASLKHYDPHRRPWWETGYRLRPEGDRPNPLKLRVDLWRMMQWGIGNTEFDAGPFNEALYQGSPSEGLLHPEWHELATLKRAFVSLNRKFHDSRILSEQVRLLEPGMPKRPDLVVKAGEAWQDWLIARRFPPLWVPRELLERHDTPAFFTGCKMLLAPGTLLLSQANGQALKRWVREGGILVATDPVGHYTPDGEPDRWIQRILGVPLQMDPSGLVRIPQDVRAKSGVEILRSDHAGRPAIVLAHCEKGYLLLGMGDVVHTPVWHAVLDRLAQFSLPMHDMRTSVAPEQLELLLREADGGHRFLAALNPSQSQPIRALVEILGEYHNVRDLAGHREVHMETSAGNGVTYLNIDLDPAQAAIYDLGLNQSKLSPAETRRALEALQAQSAAPPARPVPHTSAPPASVVPPPAEQPAPTPAPFRKLQPLPPQTVR